MSQRKYSQDNEKRFILVLSIIFIILTFFLIKDIFALLIYSLLLSYFLYPLHVFYLKRFKDKRISSLATLITATLAIFIPVALLSYFLILSLVKLLVEYRLYIENPELLNTIIVKFTENFTDSTVLSSINFSEIFNNFVVFVLEITKSFFSSIPISIFYFFIVLFISYYILVYNRNILQAVNEYIPLSMRKQDEILRNLTRHVKVLFKGYFLTGIIQTGVALLGYLIFGAPNLLIITALTLITSLIPYLGTPLVWIPVAFYMVFAGDQVQGILLFLYGTFVISTVDNFIRPYLMSNKETISPPLVFIGFVGGLLAFGISGIILGPLIIAVTAILLKYMREYYELKE